SLVRFQYYNERQRRFRTSCSISSQQPSIRPLCLTKSQPKPSCFQGTQASTMVLNPPVEHALYIERHLLRHLRETRILHDFSVHAIAMCARHRQANPCLLVTPFFSSRPSIVEQKSKREMR